MGLYSEGLTYGTTFALLFWWVYVRGGEGVYSEFYDILRGNFDHTLSESDHHVEPKTSFMLKIDFCLY